MFGADTSNRRGSAESLPEVDPRDQAALALLGHDLRAVLSDVVGGLRLIAPDAMEPLIRVQMERVRASAEVLARLLEQGLGVMLGEVGPEQSEDLNLDRFLNDLDLRWSGRALETGVGFSLLRTGSLPVRFRTDRVGLDRVLSNLLGNAFKYGDRGRVTCEIALRPDGCLGFTVRDDGPGFPSSMIDRQLPFQTRPPGMTKPGSGMGLHIAADLTRQLGGRMTLRNLEPNGAEVRIDLPLLPTDPAEGPHGDDDPFLTGKRVLIADDNPTSQTILSRFAAAQGAEVVVVSNGTTALCRLECELFDLLIVDVEMPGLSGLDVIRCLRTMPGAVARLPVVAVTAYTLRSNRQAILAAGADEMLSKPLLCPHAFASVIRQIMGGASGRKPAPPLQDASGGPTTEPDPLHRLLTMAGPDTALDLLDRLISDMTGVERGLVQAGAAPDWPAIRSHSHVLISLAGVVGGGRLQSEAEALNQLAHRADRTQLGGSLASVLALLDAMIQHVSQIRDRSRAPLS